VGSASHGLPDLVTVTRPTGEFTERITSSCRFFRSFHNQLGHSFNSHQPISHTTLTYPTSLLSFYRSETFSPKHIKLHNIPNLKESFHATHSHVIIVICITIYSSDAYKLQLSECTILFLWNHFTFRDTVLSINCTRKNALNNCVLFGT